MDNIADEIATTEAEEGYQGVSQHPKVVKMKDRLKQVGIDALTELTYKFGESGE